MSDPTRDQRRLQKSAMENVRAMRRRIGLNIRALRTMRRMPLEKLSRLSGLAPDTIDRLELGKDEIGLDHIMRLSAALQIRAARLLERSAVPETPL